MRRIQQRTYQILEVSTAGDKASRTFDVFIMTLIFVNIVAVILETVESLETSYGHWFRWFDVFSVSVFTVEYALRLWSCTTDSRYRERFRGRLRLARTPMGIIDLLAILPFYLPMIFPIDLRFVRVLRMFRLFRIFKMARYSEALRILGAVVKSKKEELILVMSILLILLVFASSLMFLVEHEAQPDKFSSIPAAMWWGVATLTTVGYGDLYPVTTLGKVMGGGVAILGIGMFALPAGMLASAFAEEIQKKRQSMPQLCPHCGKALNAPKEQAPAAVAPRQEAPVSQASAPEKAGAPRKAQAT